MDKLILLALLLMAHSSSHAANSVNNSQDVNSKEMNSTVIAVNSTDAKDWNLSESEWQTYLKLIQGPSGHYYKSMTPPEVLGINADNDRDLKHYAEITAKEEHEKVEKELKFDYAFHEAAERLYADEPIIRDFAFTPFSSLANENAKTTTSLLRGDHVALFVDLKGAVSSDLLRKLISQVKNVQGSVLDIYCVNYTDEESIQQWAKKNFIPMELVMSDKVTINKSNRNAMTSKRLPYAFLVHGGDSKVINLEDI